MPDKNNALPNSILFLFFLMVLFNGIASSAQAQEVSIEYNGLTLNANLEMAESKGFGDGMVLIVHGFGAHYKMEIIESMQRALLDNDRSSLAINLSLGIDKRQGFIDCDWDHRHIQDNAIDEIGAWVLWSKQQGTSDIVLMGHSRGANQAMVYVADHRAPEVTRLVMLAPGVGDLKRAYEDRYGDIFDETLQRMYRLAASGEGEQIVENIDIWYCPKARVTPDNFLSYYGEQSRFRQFRGNLSKVDIPTLVITGTRDEVEPYIRKQVGPFVGDGRIHLSVIEEAGHFFRDFNIDEAAEVAVAFLQETGGN